MTDAAHLLSDVAAFCISLFAVWLAERPPTKTHTFGFHRIEALGALVSVLLIWGITGVLVYEAIGRIIKPGEAELVFRAGRSSREGNLRATPSLRRAGRWQDHVHRRLAGAVRQPRHE